MLLWADGFEHYGTDTGKMLDGIYGHNNCTLSTAQAQTGTTSAYKSTANNNLVDTLRKVLPATVTKVGMSGHFYFPGLPSSSNFTNIFALHSSVEARNVVLSVIVDANGAIRFNTGQSLYGGGSVPGTNVGTTNPIITANAWTHVEVQCFLDPTVGWVRVAINGIHRYELTGVNTTGGVTGGVGSISQWINFGGNGPFYIDNLMYYDFLGTPATDTDFCPTVDGGGKATNYIGELQCIYLPPNGNTASDAWLKSTGTSAFALVDETSPVDDTDYIYSATLNDLTELDLADLPTQITYVRGLMVIGRQAKSDAGAAQTQMGMKSVAAVTDATSRAITTIPTYWWDFINVDPNSSSRWTRASLNAAKFRIKRSL